jgi:hypothetical protein
VTKKEVGTTKETRRGHDVYARKLRTDLPRLSKSNQKTSYGVEVLGMHMRAKKIASNAGRRRQFACNAVYAENCSSIGMGPELAKADRGIGNVYEGDVEGKR